MIRLFRNGKNIIKAKIGWDTSKYAVKDDNGNYDKEATLNNIGRTLYGDRFATFGEKKKGKGVSNLDLLRYRFNNQALGLMDELEAREANLNTNSEPEVRDTPTESTLHITAAPTLALPSVTGGFKTSNVVPVPSLSSSAYAFKPEVRSTSIETTQTSAPLVSDTPVPTPSYTELDEEYWKRKYGNSYNRILRKATKTGKFKSLVDVYNFQKLNNLNTDADVGSNTINAMYRTGLLKRVPSVGDSASGVKTTPGESYNKQNDIENPETTVLKKAQTTSHKAAQAKLGNLKRVSVRNGLGWMDTSTNGDFWEDDFGNLYDDNYNYVGRQGVFAGINKDAKIKLGSYRQIQDGLANLKNARKVGGKLNTNTKWISVGDGNYYNINDRGIAWYKTKDGRIYNTSDGINWREFV